MKRKSNPETKSKVIEIKEDSPENRKTKKENRKTKKEKTRKRKHIPEIQKEDQHKKPIISSSMTVPQLRDHLLQNIAKTDNVNLKAAEQSLIQSINYYLQVVEEIEKESKQFKKPKPPIRRGVTADEIYDLTKELNATHPCNWTTQQIQRAIDRLSEVATFFMRGTGDACQALTEFHATWSQFVFSRPDVKELMDPEIIAFDIPWAPPPNWMADMNRANAHVGNQSTGLPIPPLPLAPLPPCGYPGGAPPAAVTSVSLFSNAGNAPDASYFGGFMHGKNWANVRGFWRMTTGAAPIYY